MVGGRDRDFPRRDLPRHVERQVWKRLGVGLDHLANVQLTPPLEERQTLVYDSQSGKWINAAGGGVVRIEVRNETGAQLEQNVPVYVSGTATSGKPLVSLADASSATTMPAIGLVEAAIDDNTDGYVIAAGQVEGLQLDPATHTVGEALYVSTTAGELQNSKPTGDTDKVQKVALVSKVSSNANSRDGWAVVMGAGRVNDQNNELVALIGREDGAGNVVGTTTDTSLGTSPGAPIADNSSIWQAFKVVAQDLGVPNDGSVTTNKLDTSNSLVVLSGVTLGDIDLGTFAGAHGRTSPIAPNETVHGAFQDLSEEDNRLDSRISTVASDLAAFETTVAGYVNYHGRYDTEAGTQRAAGDVTPLTCEVYYTARPDGDGYAESEETATPPSGARIVRRLYYSDKFNADPTVSADWTAYTSQPADGTNFATAKAALLAGLNDTDATANTRGTLPVSLKMEYEAVVDRILNDYPGATAAYGVRLLDKNYSGPCMRIRKGNTSPAETTDIYFDVDGNLDEQAIADHCGTENGAVEIWYDQSGNGYHQVQETEAMQPFIFDGATDTVVKINGKPSIIFTGGGQLQNVTHSSVTVNLMPTFNSTSPAPGYTFGVMGTSGLGTYTNFMMGTSTGGPYMGFCTTGGSGATENQLSVTYWINQTQQISPTRQGMYNAMGSQGIATMEWTSTTTDNHRWYLNYNYFFVASLRVQEYIIYYADKSSDQSGIEDTMNDYYSVY